VTNPDLQGAGSRNQACSPVDSNKKLGYWSLKLKVKFYAFSTIIDGKTSYDKDRTLPMIRHNDPTSLGAKAELAFEDACRNVIERARLSNTKIVICRDDKVVKLTPDEAAQELQVNLAKRQDKLLES
jgi:hypothetical protein